MNSKDVDAGLRQRMTDWSADTVTITPPPSGGPRKVVLPRKVRASLTISLVWGAFCGAAMVLARAFFVVPNYYQGGALLLMIRRLAIEFLVFTAIGTVFGLLFTTILALFGLLGAGIGSAMVNSARRGAGGENRKTLSS